MNRFFTVLYRCLLLSVILQLGCNKDMQFAPRTENQQTEIIPKENDQSIDPSLPPDTSGQTPEADNDQSEDIVPPVKIEPPTVVNSDQTPDEGDIVEASSDKSSSGGGVVLDCSVNPTDPNCLLYDGSIFIDCSKDPYNPECTAHEGFVGDTCAASSGSDDVGDAMCNGRKGQVLFEECSTCMDQHAGDPQTCGPCMNRKFGILVTEKEEQVGMGQGGKLDILWVLDNSPSMSDEQGDIARNFGKFIQSMSGLTMDYRIALTLTDPDNKGKFVSEVFNWDTPDLVAKFKAAVDRISTQLLCQSSTGPCTYEQGLSTAVDALRLAVNGTLPNTNFYRSDAKLAVIFVSDSDDMTEFDQSRKYIATGSRDAQINELIGLKTDPKQVSLSSFVADGSPGCKISCWHEADGGGYTCNMEETGHDQIESIGDRYIFASEKTGGLVASICDADFDQVLEALGANAAGLKIRFKLAGEPDPFSIVVWVDGTIVPRSKSNGWTYDKDTLEIVFHGTWIPKPSAQVKMSYYRDSL